MPQTAGGRFPKCPTTFIIGPILLGYRRFNVQSLPPAMGVASRYLFTSTIHFFINKH
jgi:hypothetical protein